MGIKDVNTPGTAGGPGGRDRTLAVKSGKNGREICFFFRKQIKFTPQNITWEFPRSGSKAKDGEKKEEEEREKERLNDGNNNGEATHGARKPPRPIYLFVI